MGQVIATATRTFACTSDLERGIRVKLSAGVLAAAGAADDDLGTMATRYESTGLGASGQAAVVLKNAQGTVEMVASEAIAIGDVVEKAASGKVAVMDTGGSLSTTYEPVDRIGIALTAATADGDIIEVLPDAWA